MSDFAPRLPTFFIPHGGGPCFFMDWTMGPRDTWDGMETFLRGLASELPRPRAVLVVSAHWEEAAFTVNAAQRPPLLYDYTGFPEHTYRLRYPASGDPALARRSQTLLRDAGLAARQIDDRGLDHGVFIPFMLIYPQADVPIVQLSLRSGLDPAEHLAAGRALAPLRDDGVLIVGSGMSYHNLQAMFSPQPHHDAAVFDEWLSAAMTAAPDMRERALADWMHAPGARSAHPREEHLLPLMVAAGAAGDGHGRRVYAENVMGVPVSGFRFG